ncbi:helix-turn-helix domain-containing protein [Mycobacterium sp.]|jgi:AraC-like DNA-binding protein|uniref:helix-turn-helix domain-containing protein n=1 Tax=Mycobacterium sp. TaxID=1785 RepID=UPI002D307461|nr:helix-turn-helix domain-containing protein [Mycobacterium sp.]HZA09676.1 helix-turn-helix domain-containing protein [Mycobacterium sp.]
MRRQLEGMLNRPVRKRITFARSLSLDTAASRNWFDLVRILAREAGQPHGVLSHRLAVENLQQLLIQGLLLIQPHNYADTLAESERSTNAAVVKRLRLHKVHAELLNSCAGTATVSTVAARWGFLHMGRFAEQYHQLFGENPSQTLRVAD